MNDPTFALFPDPPAPAVPDIPRAERPEIRLMEASAEYLTDSELLSLLLPRLPPVEALEISRRLLQSVGSLKNLASIPPSELLRLHGLGYKTACAVHAAFALACRFQKEPAEVRPHLGGPADAADLLRDRLRLKQQEEFHVLLLDTRNHLIRDEIVNIGLVDRCQAHAREVFRSAIRETCSRVLLAHNHPSGDPTPSPQDLECTRNLVAAGKVVGIEVMDHVILGERTPDRPRFWLSMKEENLL